jgi:hypothetical protein
MYRNILILILSVILGIGLIIVYNAFMQPSHHITPLDHTLHKDDEQFAPPIAAPVEEVIRKDLP